MNRRLFALGQAVSEAASDDRTDAQLLDAYVANRDGAAFAALVGRHGAMVLGVCQRILIDVHAADDAFQASFLVLARKANLVRGNQVGPWLYGVACRAAQQMRAAVLRRANREQLLEMDELPDPVTVNDGLRRDLIPLLDRELALLPEKYRLPVILCAIQGRTRREVSEQLGWPEGTVAGRLAVGRTLLAKRLTRRGVPVSGSVLITVIAQQVTLASVPHGLMRLTVRIGSNGAVAAPVATIANGVMKVMVHTSRNLVVSIGLAAVLVSGGAAYFYRPAVLTGQPPVLPTAAKPTPPPAGAQAADAPKPLADGVVWGDSIAGLQAGIGFAPGGNRAYQLGESVPLVVLLRNVSGKEMTLNYTDGFFVENPPVVRGPDGKPATLSKFPIFGGLWRRSSRPLKADEVIEFGTLTLDLAPVGAKESGKPTLFAIPGTHQVQYTRLSSIADINPAKPLATGRLDLVVKATEPAGRPAAPPPEEPKGKIRDQSQPVSAPDVPKGNAGLLTLTTEGNRVHVRFKLGDYEYEGVAERVAYDAEKTLLTLEAVKTDGVRLLKYRGKDIVEELTCQKVVLDGRKQTLSVVGAAIIRW